MTTDYPGDWKRAAEHMGALALYAARDYQPALAFEAAKVAAHHGRLWLGWQKFREEEDIEEEMFSAIPCAKCRDKFRPEGTERGGTYEQ